MVALVETKMLIMDEFEIKLIDYRYLREMAIVFCDSFDSQKTINKVCEEWRIKHFSNPVNNSIAVGAFDNDVLIGINLFIPLKYWCNGEIIHVVQSCESGVLKRYRKRGIFKRIMQFAMDYFKEKTDYVAMIGFPNYENSYGAFIKLQWETLFEMQNTVVFLKLICFMVNKLGLIKGKKLDYVEKIDKAYEIDGYILEWKYGIGKEIITNSREIEKTELVLEKEFIEWKSLCHDYFTCNIVKGDEKIFGVIQLCHTGNMRYAKLIKYNDNTYNPKVRRKMIRLFFSQLYAEGIVFLRMWNSVKGEKLFVKREWFLKSHHNPFIVYALNDKYKNIIYDGSKWNVGFLDLD